MIWSPIELTVHVGRYYFGGRQMAQRLLKPDLPDEPVAETWEVCDWGDQSATVFRGPMKGATLRELVTRHPDEVVGAGWRGPHFPLLAKFLDASEALPVHLHARDDKAAAIYGEPNGKDEAWHILHAEPGASALVGIKPGIDPEDVATALREARYEDVMERREVKAGDTVFVPGGILHTFGPGLLIYEIQQTSMLARHVMQVDLQGEPIGEEERETNIQAVMQELETDWLPAPHPGLARPAGESTISVGCASPKFALERWEVRAPIQVAAHPQSFRIVTNVGQRPMNIRWAYGGLGLGQGKSVLIPAAIGAWSISPYLGQSTAIVTYVPDLDTDIIAPLREAGYDDAAIGALGDVFATEEA